MVRDVGDAEPPAPWGAGRKILHWLVGHGKQPAGHGEVLAEWELLSIIVHLPCSLGKSFKDSVPISLS